MTKSKITKSKIYENKRTGELLTEIPIREMRDYKEFKGGDVLVLSRDGKEILRTTCDYAIANYIHSNHSYSVHHALTYEGYKIKKEKILTDSEMNLLQECDGVHESVQDIINCKSCEVLLK
jgi:hypothetical protein